MAVASVSTGAASSISQLVSPDAPVLIFEIDASAAQRDGGSRAQRTPVRLIGTFGGGAGHAGERSAHQELSAVLVLRALTPSRLLSCVRAVSGGSAAVTPEALPEISAPGLREQPTEREYEVLRRLADGDTTRDIAQRLCYSERTVKNVVHDLLEKLNCRTRAHAVGLAVRQGVI